MLKDYNSKEYENILRGINPVMRSSFLCGIGLHMCFPGLMDTNQNDKVSILELNKFSKEGGMVKGINDFIEKSKGEYQFLEPSPLMLNPLLQIQLEGL